MIPTRTDVITSLALLVANAVVCIQLSVGVAAVTLSYVRNAPDWSKIWTGVRKWGDCFLLQLWPGVIFTVYGLFPVVELLIPLTLAAMLWVQFASFALSETEVRYKTAVSRSFRLVSASFWPAVLFSLVLIVLPIAGMLACCVGIFLTYPLSMALAGVGYNELTSGKGVSE